MATAQVPEQVGQLGHGALVQLVKLVQRYQLSGSLGNWNSYQKKHAQQQHGDPQRHQPEILRDFLLSLLKPIEVDSKPSAAPSSQQAALPHASQQPGHEFNLRVLRRAMRASERADKERRLGATSAPPALPKAQGHTGHAQQGAQHAAVHRVWHLVHATRAHDKYKGHYSFPSALPGWARTKRRRVRTGDQVLPAAAFTATAGVPPRLLAIDCEMVATADDPAALAKLSIVDEAGNVVYTSMVRPRGTITNYNTALTGITEAHLQDVSTTRSEVRRAVKQLLLESFQRNRQLTVLIGHGLHNDLQALHLDYQPVIDTALLFSYSNLPTCTPSLRDLHRLVLGSDMPTRTATGQHDSVEDARAAMKLVQHELGQPHRTPPLPAPATKVDKEGLRKLLVHSIPAGVTEEQLLALFSPLLRSPPAAAPATESSRSSAPGTSAPAPSDSSSSDSDSSDSGSDSDDDTLTVNIEALKPAAPQQAAAQRRQPAACLTQMPVFESQPGIARQRAVLVFKHPGELNDAFKALPGKPCKDTMGRPAKEVRLPGGRVIKLRKSAAHNGFQFAQQQRASGPGKRPAPAAAAQACKKARSTVEA